MARRTEPRKNQDPNAARYRVKEWVKKHGPVRPAEVIAAFPDVPESTVRKALKLHYDRKELHRRPGREELGENSDLTYYMKPGWEPNQSRRIFDPFGISKKELGLLIEIELRKRALHPMKDFRRWKGMPGVYFIFYDGDFTDPSGHQPYESFRGWETPIYIGQAKDLCKRLKDHKRSLEQVLNLDEADFQCKAMPTVGVYRDSFERAAHDHWRPYWVFDLIGFGSRSQKPCHKTGEKGLPFDKVHPGRSQGRGLPRTEEQMAIWNKLRRERERREEDESGGIFELFGSDHG